MNMHASLVRLKVFFDDPFWIGVFEKHCDGQIRVARVVFGPEPKMPQILAMMNRCRSIEYSAPQPGPVRIDAIRINPKRRQRMINRDRKKPGCSTNAQLALKHHQESRRELQQQSARERKEEALDRKFQMKQAKRKARKRGH